MQIEGYLFGTRIEFLDSDDLAQINGAWNLKFQTHKQMPRKLSQEGSMIEHKSPPIQSSLELRSDVLMILFAFPYRPSNANISDFVQVGSNTDDFQHSGRGRD